MTTSHEDTGSYWVIIPAYNEAETVRDVAMRVRQQCANVVVVDDGSTDGTARVFAGLDVTVLRNEENLGKAGSLSRGFDHALGHEAAGVITLDADGRTYTGRDSLLRKSSPLDDPNAFLIGARRRDQRKSLVLAVCGKSDRRLLDWLGCGAADRRQSIGISTVSRPNLFYETSR